MIDLRPRNIVELLDRAVSIAVRQFVPLFLLSLIVEGALDIITYTDPAHRDAYEYFGKPSVQAGLAGGSAIFGATMRRIIAYAAEPFQVSALAAAVGALVVGGSVSVSKSLAVAARRYPVAIAVGAMYAAAMWGLEPLSASVVKAAAHHQPPGVFGPQPFAVGVLFGFVYVALRLAGFVAVVAATLEPIGPIRAALVPLRLFTNGRRVARTLGAMAIVFGLEVMQGLGDDAAAAIIVRTLHSRFVYDVAAIAIGTTESLLAVTFVTMFYYDARVRYDALDIQLALAAR